MRFPIVSCWFFFLLLLLQKKYIWFLLLRFFSRIHNEARAHSLHHGVKRVRVFDRCQSQRQTLAIQQPAKSSAIEIRKLTKLIQITSFFTKVNRAIKRAQQRLSTIITSLPLKLSRARDWRSCFGRRVEKKQKPKRKAKAKKREKMKWRRSRNPQRNIKKKKKREKQANRSTLIFNNKSHRIGSNVFIIEITSRCCVALYPILCCSILTVAKRFSIAISRARRLAIFIDSRPETKEFLMLFMVDHHRTTPTPEAHDGG